MKNIRAFTMVELMITVLLLSVVMAGVYGVLVAGNRIFTMDSVMMDMEAQCRNAADRILREVRQASSQVITVNVGGSTNDQLEFFTPSTPLNAQGIRYYLNGQNLVREYPQGTLKTLATSMSLLKFSVNGSLLTIRTSASRTMYGQPQAFSLTQNVRLRNE